MDITERTVGNCLILDCMGRITVGPNVMALHNAVNDAIRNGTRKIILHLAAVEYSDTSGLSELVSCYTRIQGLGGRFILLNPSKRISDLLDITRISTELEIYRDEKAALDSLGC
jgi:anti-sigma B factor antagonist